MTYEYETTMWWMRERERKETDKIVYSNDFSCARQHNSIYVNSLHISFICSIWHRNPNWIEWIYTTHTLHRTDTTNKNILNGKINQRTYVFSIYCWIAFGLKINTIHTETFSFDRQRSIFVIRNSYDCVCLFWNSVSFGFLFFFCGQENEGIFFHFL